MSFIDLFKRKTYAVPPDEAGKSNKNNELDAKLHQGYDPDSEFKERGNLFSSVQYSKEIVDHVGDSREELTHDSFIGNFFKAVSEFFSDKPSLDFTQSSSLEGGDASYANAPVASSAAQENFANTDLNSGLGGFGLDYAETPGSDPRSPAEASNNIEVNRGSRAALPQGMAAGGGSDDGDTGTSSVSGSDGNEYIPVLRMSAASGDEDTPMWLTIGADYAGPDSELLYRISGIPAGGSLSAGQDMGNGEWDLTAQQLSNLYFDPPNSWSGNLVFSVTVTADHNGEISSSTANLNIDVEGVASTPTLSAQSANGLENVPISLNIVAALSDTDGSETLSILISDVPAGGILSAGTDNGDGSWTLTPGQLPGLFFIPPLDFSGALDLHITATSHENGTSNSVSIDLNVAILGVASIPVLNLQDVIGLEDHAIPLIIDAHTSDPLGETLSILIGNVPAGAQLSAGTDNGNGTWTLMVTEIIGLTFTPPANFSGAVDLHVIVTSQENGTQAQTQGDIHISVGGVADAPMLSVLPAAGLENTNIALPISATLVDNDGSETLTVTVSGLPNGASLSAGVNQGNGTWVLTSAQLSGLLIVPPPFYSGVFNITVSATSSEDGTQATTTLPPVAISVTGVASLPNLSVQNSSGLEGAPVAITILSSLTDTDGSETLSITIGGVPAGGQFSAGIDNGNGTWTLSPGQLAGLTFTPPLSFTGTLHFSVDAMSQEGASTITNAASLDVVILPVAHAPVITVTPASGIEDAVIALAISVVPYDPAETLSITIGNLPPGATLSAGVNNGDGTWTLTSAQLTGLTLIPAPDWNGALNLSVSAAGSLNGTTATSSTVLPGLVSGVADAPALLALNSTGLEDTAIVLHISAALANTNGAEVLSVVISGIPPGAILSSGIDNGNGSWTLTPAQLAGLTLTGPSNYSGQFDLTVTATSSESGTTATATTMLNVAIAGVADVPNLSLQSASGLEGGAIALNITSTLTDTDGSETLSIVIGNVPAGAVLSAGVNNQDGTWTLTPAQLSGLTITPPLYESGLLNLSVIAISSENGTTAQTAPVTLPVTIQGVADAPSLIVQAATGLEDAAIPLVITASLNDADGSETLSVIIAGVPAGAVLSAGTNNGNGSWTLTAAQISGLTLTPPANWSGAFDLSVSAISTEGATSAHVDATLHVTVGGVADVPNLTVSPSSGAEGAAIALNISASLTDTDGSETLSILIGNVPAGAVLSAGINNHDGTWTLTAAQLSGLTITPPLYESGLLNLSVVAISSENGTTAQTAPVTLPVTIQGVADLPNLSVQATAGLEDTAIPLVITASLNDTDGSEILSVTISGVPVGATLSAGINNGNGTWTLTAAQLAGLTLTPPANWSGAFDLSVSAISTEGATSAHIDATLHVTVGGVADVPTLTVLPSTGAEGAAIALNISATLTDTDGSEALSIVIGNVPAGALLSAGVNNHDGTWTLTAAQLSGLTITPPLYESGLLNLSVVAIAAENGTTAQTTPVTLPVTIQGVADLPNLNVQAAVGLEDSGIPLVITASLNDTDGSENLSVTISGVPVGAVLSAGVNNGNGSWTLTAAQLAGLTLTPPANWSGAFDLTVSAISTEGVTSAHVDATLHVTVTGVADVPNLSIQPAAGLEGAAIALNISASLSDTDGSEALSIIVGNVPSGVILSAGINNHDGTWTLTQAQLSGLTITPPLYESGTLNLSVIAIASENGTTAQTAPVTLPVTIEGVADVPNLSVQAAAGLEDAAIPLVITASLNDTDGSEVLSVVISGLPAGAALSAGTNNGNGSWTLTAAQLVGLTLTPPANWSGAVDLTVSAISTEGLSTNHIDATLHVTVAGVADVPTLSVSPSTGAEGAAIALNISAALTDTDGSEALSVIIGNVPAGAVLSAGVNNHDGTWTLTAAQLSGLTITPPLYESGLMNLSVIAISSENGTTAQTAAVTLPVTIQGVADLPNLNVQAAAGLEDAAIPLVITASLNDTDGSEILSVTVSGVPAGASLSAGINNGNGTWTLTSAQLAGLALTPPANWSGAFDLTVSAISTEGTTSAHVDATLHVSVAGVADTPNLSVQPATGLEGAAIALNITSTLTDTDGSETLSVVIGNVPTGAVLSAGVNNHDGTWTLTAAQLSGLTITPPLYESGLLNLSVIAIASENGTTAQTAPVTLPITIQGVADAPNLIVQAAAGLEDTAIPLVITASLNDTDGSEILSATISGVPAGATLSAGINNGNGSWTLTAAQLAGLTLTPPSNWSGAFDLTVSAISTEGATTAHVDATLHVTVAGVADAAILSVLPAVGLEDAAIPLVITASLNDTDGSETLAIVISGVPTGAVLSAGINNGNGNWTLSPAQLAGLTLTAAPNWSGAFDLGIFAVSAEGATNAHTDAVLHVTVSGVADVPVLHVSPSTGAEGAAIALNISASLSDTDGSEFLSVVIGNVPSGAILSAGVNNNNGTWTLTAAQLTGLTMTPPPFASGLFNLTVVAIASENTTTAQTAPAFLPVTVTGVADIPNLNVQAAVGLEDAAIPLVITASLNDTDGSETLAVTVSGVPVGATLSAGINNGNGNWTLTAAQLVSLSLTPPANWSGSFNLAVSAISTEGITSAHVDATLHVTITGVADAPSLVLIPVVGVEDTPVALNINASLLDLDGSETLSVVVAGVPVGATLSAGVNNGNGSWTLTSTQLSGLTLTPPQNWSGDVTLTVTATATEGASSASVNANLNVHIAGVADGPLLSVLPAVGLEDTAIALNITAALIDLDGSESLSVIVTGMPAGSALSAGVNNGNGTWTLTPAQLTGLTFTPPLHQSGLITLGVQAISSENGTQATASASLPVAVGGVATAPSLSVSAATSVEDVPIPLVIGAALLDTDGSETLSVRISGVPAGASLSAGTNNGGGIWTLTPLQLVGLILTPPANWSGHFDLSVAAISSENATTATTQLNLSVTISGVADLPNLTVLPAAGVENAAVALNISSSLTDTDGSETLSITISGVPAGASLSAGLNAGGGIWVLTPAQLSGLTLTPAANYNGVFSLTVVALSSENATTNSVTANLPVIVAGVGSTPILAVGAAAGVEDNIIPLSISASLSDSSEVLSVVISGVPAGSILSHGIFAGTGKWSLSPSDLSGLTITPPANYSGIMTLTVTAISTETNGATGSLSVPLNVVVTPVVDVPSLSVTAAVGNEDTAISLNILAKLTDLDGSETLTARITGVPLTATLSAGMNLGGGIWSLTAAQLTNLKITPLANSDADFVLGVSVTATESNGATSITNTTLPVTVNAVADIPTSTASSVASLGNVVSLTLNGALGDNDGSETITYVVHGIPDGFALSKGINNGDNTWTLRPTDLSGLTLTAPEQFNGQLNLNVTAVSHDVGGSVAIGAATPFYTRFRDYSNGYLVDLGVGVNVGGIGVGVHVGVLPDIDLLPATGGVLGVSGIYAKEDTSFYIADAPNLLGLPILSAVLGLISKFEFSGIPTGVTFSAGTNMGGGVWQFTSAQLNNLYMNLPANSSTDFTIVMGVRMLVIADISLFSVPVHVMGVADLPTLSANLGAGTEDNAVTLNITSALTDLDGSESLSFIVSGMPAGFTLNHGINNGNGTWSLQSSDLTGLTVIPAENFSGTANLTVSAISTEREGDQIVRQQSLSVNIAAAADAPLITALPVQINEDQSVTLNLGISLKDTDGSEQISAVTISGLPAGATLTGATDNHNGTWSADVAHLDQVRLYPPSNWSGDFNLSVTATSRESSNGTTANTVSTIPVHVTGVADVPAVTATDSTGNMGQAITLHLGAALSDTDGSETLSAVISGLPSHSMLSAGINNGDGSWTVTGAQLSGLTLTPPDNFVGDLTLSMTAYSLENNGNANSAPQSFTVHVMTPPAAMMMAMSVVGNDLYANQNGWAADNSADTHVAMQGADLFNDHLATTPPSSDHDQAFQNHNTG